MSKRKKSQKVCISIGSDWLFKGEIGKGPFTVNKENLQKYTDQLPEIKTKLEEMVTSLGGFIAINETMVEVDLKKGIAKSDTGRITLFKDKETKV